MGDAATAHANLRRLIWIAVLVGAGFLIAVAAGVLTLTWGLVHMLDHTGAHVCGLAAVRRSPAAARLVGTPVEQRGFTGGSSSSVDGEVVESVHFTVGGPRGTASVASEGHRSPFDSYLKVRIGRNGRGATVYSGTFDCAELHATGKSRGAIP